MAVVNLPDDRYLCFNAAVAGSDVWSDAVGVEGWTQSLVEVYPGTITGTIEVCAEFSNVGPGSSASANNASWMPDTIQDTSASATSGNNLKSPLRRNVLTWIESGVGFPISIPVSGKWMRIRLNGTANNVQIVLSRQGNR